MVAPLGGEDLYLTAEGFKEYADAVKVFLEELAEALERRQPGAGAAINVPRKMTAEERERVNVAVEEASRRGLVREVRSLEEALTFVPAARRNAIKARLSEGLVAPTDAARVVAIAPAEVLGTVDSAFLVRLDAEASARPAMVVVLSAGAATWEEIDRGLRGWPEGTSDSAS